MTKKRCAAHADKSFGYHEVIDTGDPEQALALAMQTKPERLLAFAKCHAVRV